WAALALAWSALLVASWSRAARRQAARGGSGWLEIVLTNVAFGLVLGELALRAYAALAGHSLLVRESLDAYRLKPHLYGRLHTNSYGYPSREFELRHREGIRRIAIVGDSFAVGAVRQDQNFASWIERLRPNIEVYNFGINGTGPRDYYEIIRSEALRFAPDIILVSFFVGNDVTDWRPLPDLDHLRPQGYALYLFVHRSWRLAREWYRKSHEAAPNAALLWPPPAPAPPEKGHNLSRETHLQVEHQRLLLSCPALAASYEPSWERALSTLRRIDQLCRAARVPFGVLIIPDEYQINPALLEEVLQHSGVTRESVDLDLLQSRLRAFLKRRGIDYLDLKPKLEGEPDVYLPRDTHFNERGNRLVAEHIAAWLDRLPLSN
ncbi:MAG TPA: SGNH/GDSL hydrolase family protein, partial [Acidobacteriota bacterium]